MPHTSGGPPAERSSSPDDGAADATADRSVDDDAESGEEPPPAAGPTTGDAGGREVEVPGSLYRVVTVFSTLLSILVVVLGFSILGAATTVVNNPPGSLVVQALALVVPMEVLAANSSAIALAVGLVGLATVTAGAGVYVYGSRFRAPGMGKPKDASAEDSNDG